MTPKEFFNPRFTTSEMETSTIRNPMFRFEQTAMIFDDEKPGYPTRTLGRIWQKDTKSRIVVWGKFGDCWINGDRFRDCDMVRKNQNQIETGKYACIVSAILLIVLVLSLIF